MTNPDNVGGLPELPEPGHYDDYEGEWYWTGSQMRAYGELCRAEALQRVSENAANMLAMPIEPGTLELCRAAPAGGDLEAAKAAVLEIETYFEEREDVVDGDYGRPVPNREMTMLRWVREVISFLAKADVTNDVFEASKAWPEDIRAKLSAHDLRRMNGWAPRTKVGDWRIDTSAGGPILVYQNCSVVEGEQARYVMNLIERDSTGSAPAESGEAGQLIGRLYAAARHVDMASKKLPDAFNGWEARDIAEAAALLRKLQQGAHTGKVVAHRLHTPGGKWQWIDGEPSLGTLDLWKSYGWTLEYAYAASQGQEGGHGEG